MPKRRIQIIRAVLCEHSGHLRVVLKQTEGTVLLDGIIYNERNYEKIQKKIGYLPQEIELYPNLTVKECLEYMGGL